MVAIAGLTGCFDPVGVVSSGNVVSGSAVPASQPTAASNPPPAPAAPTPEPAVAAAPEPGIQAPPAPELPVAPSGGSAELSWVPPTENTDSSVNISLAGYRIYSGNAGGALQLVRTINGADVTNAVVDGLASGTHYFAVTAFSILGVESEFSDILSKTIP
jgi:hypothetical protein